MKKDYIAVGFSDLHLTLHTPQCRQEQDWLAVQANYLSQIKALAGDTRPVLFAGDLFDRWNPAAELIRFAIDELPTGMYCVPGQHDLPNHAMELMHKSGYGVLKACGKIEDISGRGVFLPDFFLEGCGWGQVSNGISDKARPSELCVLVSHRYIWDKRENSFEGMKEDTQLHAFKKELWPFNAAIFGDNHKGFLASVNNFCSVLNSGTFIRRKSDEVNYVPRVGLLQLNGEWRVHALDTSGDKFKPESEQRPEMPFNMRDFKNALETIGKVGFNFREAVENHLRSTDIDKQTKAAVLEALQDGEID